MTGPAPDLLALLDETARGAARVRFVADDHEVPFTGIWRAAHGAAAWLRRHLPGRDPLAMVLQPSAPSLVALLGGWLAGRPVASLPRPARGMEAAEHVRQCAELVALVGATALVVPHDLSADLTGGVGVPVLRPYDIGRLPGALGEADDGAGLVQFTSGSTAGPAGVRLSMANLGANVTAIATALDHRPADVFASWLPLSHDLGLIGSCLGPLAGAARHARSRPLVLLDTPERFRRSPGSWLRLVSDASATVTMAPTTALPLAARALARHGSATDLRSLRCLVVGAEMVTREALTAFGEVGARHGLRPTALSPAYGLAEATLGVTTSRPDERWHGRCRQPPDGEIGPVEVVAVGRPLPGVEVRTRAMGSRGADEVQVRGPSVATTYLGRSSPVTIDGWLGTGDLGELVDGELHLVGRVAERLTVAGRQLHAGHLARALGAVAGVRPGCCVVFGDDPGGYVVAWEPDRAAPRSLDLVGRELVARAVETAGSTPNRVVAVAPGSLPQTPSGKVQPARTRDHLAADALDVVADVRPRAGRR